MLCFSAITGHEEHAQALLLISGVEAPNSRVHKQLYPIPPH